MVLIRYIVCPLCAHNHPIDSQKRGRFDFKRFNMAGSEILQVREQHGRVKTDDKPHGYSQGFTSVESEYKSLVEMIATGRDPDVLDSMKEQVLAIVKHGVDIGWIDKKDIV